MALTQWLIDKSALVRLSVSEDPESWGERIEGGLVRISMLTLLEVGYSSRATGDFRSQLKSAPLSATPVEYLTPGIEDRALDVQV